MNIGDKIVDLEISELFKVKVITSIIELSHDMVTVDNPDLPNQYPHSFLMSEKDVKWALA